MSGYVVNRYGMDIDLSKTGHTGCPRCISNGEDSSGNNLMVYGLTPDNEHRGAFSRQSSNRRKNSLNKSGRIGVYWRKDTNKWRVSITVDKMRHNLGEYSSYDVACNVCEEAELRLLGYSRKEY